MSSTCSLMRRGVRVSSRGAAVHCAQGRRRAAKLRSPPDVVCLRLEKRSGPDVVGRRLRGADAQVFAEALDCGVAARIDRRSSHGGGACRSEQQAPAERRVPVTGLGQARSVVR